MLVGVGGSLTGLLTHETEEKSKTGTPGEMYDDNLCTLPDPLAYPGFVDFVP